MSRLRDRAEDRGADSAPPGRPNAGLAPERPRSPAGPEGRPRAARDWRFWALLGFLGLLLGLYLAFPRLDSDQAVTGLMGWYILRGEFPVFFWMQHHAGVPESYVAAPLFHVFGLSRRTLDLVPALGTVALALAVYRTGAVLFGHAAGLLGILFTTVVSAYVAANYTLARSYYVEHLLVGQLVLLGAALWLARPLSEPARCRVAIAMGLCGGLGLYFNFQVVDALVPAGLALLLVDPTLPVRRAAWLGVGAFLLGSLPFWIYNLTHGWATVLTGAKFQGRFAVGEATRILFADLLPVILGMRAAVDRPPHLPGPLAWIIPGVVGAAVLLLLGRVVAGATRLRRDPARAGEAMLLAGLGVTLGVVWYGGYVRVPRYLLPLVPFLALVLARATQLGWRRTRPGTALAIAAYLVAVGIDLAPDVTALSPHARARYRRERTRDARLFAVLREEDLRHAYAFDYWLAPRLTFDARGEIVVAEPFNDRYPPHTAAVDATARPAYIVQAGVETFRGWLEALQVTARVRAVGDYRVFHDFTPPPAVVPLPRAGWTARASPGRGEVSSVLDARLDTGWASVRGPAHSAWIEVDLGTARPLAGVTLVTDRPQHVPVRLVVLVDDVRAGERRVAQLQTEGIGAAWADGAPRVAPSRTVTVRFPPVAAQRVRLVETGPAGTWSVAELFLLAPAGDRAPDPGAAAAVLEGRRLERAGALEPALVRFHAAMTQAPDDPDGYDGFARVAGGLRLRAGSLPEQAARLEGLGLHDAARATYVEVARALGSGRVHAEIWRAIARLSAAGGDPAEAARLDAEARAVLAPARPVGAVLGGVTELLGYDLTPEPLRPGQPAELTTHWRLPGDAASRLMVWVHFRAADQGTRFGDDYPLPAPVPGLGAAAQHLSVRRRVVVPPDATPGRYRIVAGVWDPRSGRRLHRWWRGALPTFESALELGTVEVAAPPR